MEFSNILKKKQPQPQKVTHYLIPFLQPFQNDKIIEMGNKLVVAKD